MSPSPACPRGEDGELVADLALDDPLQRPGAEGGVVALVGQRMLGGLGDLERDAPLGQPLAQAVQLDVDDAARGRPR